MNPITPDVVIRTALFEIGLSAAFLVAVVFVLPRLKRRADEMWPHTKLRWIHPNRIVNFFWPLKFLGMGGWRQEQRPYHRYLKTWILYYYGQGFAWLMLGLVVFELATSVGLINNSGLPALQYYLLFARANGAPNGAHIDSYLSITVIGLYAAYITKDFWFGASFTAFGYALHEGLWLPVQYVAYFGYYLNASVAINIERDAIFAASITLIAIAFWKNPLRKVPMRAFAGAIAVYIAWLAAWYFLPPLLGNYPYFPITTINNPIVGLGAFQETPWYSGTVPNFFESGGWVLLSSALAASLYLWNKRNRA